MESRYDLLYAKVNNILEERDSIFPARPNDNTEKMKRYLAELLDFLEEQKSVRSWSPDKRIVKQAENIKEQGVFLCGPMKSGTTLLLELLDGHDELSVLPGDSWLWRMLCKGPGDSTFGERGWARHWVKRFINPKGQKPFWLFGPGAEQYIFLLNYFDFWYSKLPAEKRRVVLAVIFSYLSVNPFRPLHPTRWVEKTPGNELRVKELNTHFPEAKYIHVIRDPRENLASIKRLYLSREWPWNVRSFARSLSDSYRLALHYSEKFGRDRYMVIRYEDLTSNTREVMSEIADFIGVSWSDSFLVPTVNRALTKANTMYADRQVTGAVRRPTLDKWRIELSFFEQGVAQQLHRTAQKMNYSWEMSAPDYIKRILFTWSLIGA